MRHGWDDTLGRGWNALLMYRSQREESSPESFRTTHAAPCYHLSRRPPVDEVCFTWPADPINKKSWGTRISHSHSHDVGQESVPDDLLLIDELHDCTSPWEDRFLSSQYIGSAHGINTSSSSSEEAAESQTKASSWV